MCVPIQRVHRDSAGVLTHVGGSTSDGVPWGLTVAEAAALIESRQYVFFVEIPAGKRVDVLMRTSSAGNKFLTTSPDGIASNNLDVLPILPSPLAGVEPPFPLNIPGASLGQLAAVTSVAYAMHHQLHPLGTPPYGYSESNNAPVIEMPTNPWPDTPSWFYVNAILPFPAEYKVICNGLTLERVPSDSPTRRRDLEAEGKGWWSFEFILTKPDGTFDPTKPSRMTEIRAVLRPSASGWRNGSFYFSISALSINSYCPGGTPHGGVYITIARKRLPVTPPPTDPTPATTTMPSLVGQRLDQAFTILFGLGLMKIFVNNTTGVITTSDLQVVSQGPPAGTVVKLTEQVGLTVVLAAGQHGVKSVSITNQSNTAKDMDLWVFDYNTGIWESKGQVAYQGSAVVVDLTKGHTCSLAAVDTTRSNCHTGRPDEGPCVYSSTSGSFVGDSSGLIVPWQIV
jgi:hypothetical protein